MKITIETKEDEFDVIKRIIIYEVIVTEREKCIINYQTIDLINVIETVVSELKMYIKDKR